MVALLTKVLELHLHQLDVESVFLYVDLDEDICMEPTRDMDISNRYYLKLRKRFMILIRHQERRDIWEFIIGLGFKQSLLDNCFYSLK